jgi:hypothetical protein
LIRDETYEAVAETALLANHDFFPDEGRDGLRSTQPLPHDSSDFSRRKKYGGFIMSEARMEPNLDQWIGFCEKLTPYQNFALIGLLSRRPRPPLTILPSEIETEENARAAEKWSESRFRKLLLFYCEHYKKKRVEAAGELIDKAEVVKTLAPLLVSTLAIPLGIATAFLFWATGRNLDDWCKK